MSNEIFLPGALLACFTVGACVHLAPAKPLAHDGTIAAPEAELEESDFWRIETIEAPEDFVLEVSGLAVEPDGAVLVATRRGELFRIRNLESDAPSFERVWDGLHEPLGLLSRDDGLYLVQRGELSRLMDTDGDLQFDRIETVCDEWRISGNYHEYNFGPRMDAAGDLWMTTNKPFGDEPFGRADWRGYALRITADGRMIPECAGLRSPAGIQASPEGLMFYTDNQGEWCGASKLSHLEPGDFHGHPWGKFSTEKDAWPYAAIGDVPDGLRMHEVHEHVPEFKLPAVWFPYDKMGRSPAGFVWDTEGVLGPFQGQVFVGDQYQASVLRVFLEEVNGHWQGACFPFRKGFGCGIVRLAWHSGGLLTGQTARGWGSIGHRDHGLERLVWTGEVPFEIKEMRIRSDGFVLRFTKPVDVAIASDLASWEIESYTYLLHATYGSPEVDRETAIVTSAEPSADGLEVRLRIDSLRAGHVHELHALALRAKSGEALLHSVAYYTAITIPSY